MEGIEDSVLKRVLKILLANGLIGDLEDNVPDDEKKVELFEVLSKINHSCSPNVLPCERQGDTVHTRALREIEEGEELFNSYIMFMQTREERRRDLRRWHFLCGCKSCSLEGVEQENDDRARAKVMVVINIEWSIMIMNNNQGQRSIRRSGSPFIFGGKCSFADANRYCWALGLPGHI